MVKKKEEHGCTPPSGSVPKSVSEYLPFYMGKTDQKKKGNKARLKTNQRWIH